MNRAAIYARCSSQKQAERDLSVPAQLERCREFARRESLLVFREFVDEGVSALSDQRDQFQEMIAAAAASPPPFDTVVVWKLNRFTRNREHSVLYKARLARHGVRVVSICEPMDETPAGRMLEGIVETVDEFYSHNLSQDTRRGMRKNAREGGWNGGTPPTGYKVERADSCRGPAKLVPDPGFAPLVQRMFMLALGGCGALKIAQELNDESIRTRRGRRWTKNAVLNILKNEAYTGVYIWGARSHSKFSTDEADPIRTEDAHKPLVSSEDYARVQAVIAVRRPKITHPSTTKGRYLLSGILTCGCCGSPYIGHGAKSGTYHYYACQKKQKQGAKACPDAANFKRSRVEGVVMDALREGALHPGVFGDLVREVQGSLEATQDAAEGERLVLEGQLSEVNRRLNKLYEAVESGSIPASLLAPRFEQVSQDKEALEGRLAALPALGNEPLLLICDADIEAWVADLRAVVERGSVDERRALLRAWVKRVVANGDDLTVEYTFPLVNVPGPGGAPGGGGRGPATRTAVYDRRRRTIRQPGPKMRKGEPTVRRVLPTVRNGSPTRHGHEPPRRGLSFACGGRFPRARHQRRSQFVNGGRPRTGQRSGRR